MTTPLRHVAHAGVVHECVELWNGGAEARCELANRGLIGDVAAPEPKVAGPRPLGDARAEPLALYEVAYDHVDAGAGLGKDLARRGTRLAAGFADAARAAGVPLQVNAFGSLVTPFFTDAPVRDYQSALRSNTKAYAAFFHAMLKSGVYLPPSAFEAWFLSAAHDDGAVNRIVEALPGAAAAAARAAETAQPGDHA